MKKFLPFLLLVFVFGLSFAQKPLDELLDQYNSQSISYISVEELRMLQLNDTVLILDAREPEEFQTSHINTSIHVGFNNFSMEEKQLQKLDKNLPVVVYCSVGIRSEKIGEKLKKAGFTNIKNLYGGIFAWKNKGYPVVDSTGNETENVHAFSKHWSKYLHGGNPMY
ncbi:rhodanese-like domain-containing protein [Aequorivita marisscotiae]|uniref:Rhodanese-like domain-containing protein n=1 Tax=Aequorivita marisscotiae TaxID=3040348 RepID=A0ABY8KUB7_9FLAO|nr:rhodanese-like domain-containing protein [Aequorivita sp. Ant34-E75]WGF93033.1 rhodanese-like domain-containing protein [Aequorivita sp. Ant34-E75]